jgi:hypothetical protein
VTGSGKIPYYDADIGLRELNDVDRANQVTNKFDFWVLYLFCDHIGQVFERLLDRVLGHVPLELGQVGGQVHSVCHQIFEQLFSLIFENVAEVVGDLAGGLLNVDVQFAFKEVFSDLSSRL